MKKVYVIKNRYIDSVTLMGVAEKTTKLDEINGAECGMGTQANQELLTSLGYQIPEKTGNNDLMIAIDVENHQAMENAYQTAMESINLRGGVEDRQRDYYDLEELPIGKYDLAQISLPGEFAVEEIKKALRQGMDVFVFSDNVSLEEELACKKEGQTLGKLVMGPDAGVGLIDGIALAAGSIVRKGGIGIVGASGSGAQEVACLIEQLGAGVSAIIGTGGRDLRPEIGGITMKMGMDRLNANGDTQVICLVSKLADQGVMAEVLSVAKGLQKPVVAVFLGATHELYADGKIHGTFSLQEAAEKCYALLTGEEISLGWTEKEMEAIAQEQLGKITLKQKYVRGLYCGGTFTEEALIALSQQAPNSKIYSNLQTKYADVLASSLESVGHTILDLGTEEFTAQSPHPVFDPSIRLARMEKELEDPATAVVVLDFITGPGVHMDPIIPFAKVIKKHPETIFVTAICGGAQDPQNIHEAKQILEEAGAIVADSNMQSATLTAYLMKELDRRDKSAR